MSQYFIAGYEDHHQVIIGWDQPMRTFFASVIDTVAEENEEEESVLLWLGTKYDEYKDINDLAVSLADYAIIPDDIIIQCQQDAQVSFSPSPLQQLTEDKLFNGN
jgi:hypothetical protein